MAFCSVNKHFTFMCNQNKLSNRQQQITIIIYTYWILRQMPCYFWKNMFCKKCSHFLRWSDFLLTVRQPLFWFKAPYTSYCTVHKVIVLTRANIKLWWNKHDSVLKYRQLKKLQLLICYFAWFVFFQTFWPLAAMTLCYLNSDGIWESVFIASVSAAVLFSPLLRLFLCWQAASVKAQSYHSDRACLLAAG